jgi:oxygen-independent coproporphyrinogen-3 oxidase
VLPPEDLERLFSMLQSVARKHPVEEFTVEANPGTLTRDALSILTLAGVDRISIGAQSWDAADLRSLGRSHAPADVERSIRLTRAHGIARLNLDLIFGIPGQTTESWRTSLEKTLDTGVDHVSCYALTYEPGTPLTERMHAGRVSPCDEDIETEMYGLAMKMLRSAGYEQYEISNFARPGQQCLHNLIYWRQEPYIAVGPSAAGFVNGIRYKNVPNIARYAHAVEKDGEAVAEIEPVSELTLAGELLMMQLRLSEGVDVRRFEERTGIAPGEEFRDSLRRFTDAGLMHHTPERLTLTDAGRLVADGIIADMYAELHANHATAQEGGSTSATPAGR